FSGVFGVLIRLGLILGNYVTPVILAFLPWNWVFWIPAAMVTIFLVLTWRVDDDRFRPRQHRRRLVRQILRQRPRCASQAPRSVPAVRRRRDRDGARR